MSSCSHPRFRRVLSAYADRELDADSAEAVSSHLLECDRCRHHLRMMLAIKGSLRRLVDAEPSPLAARRLRRWAASLEGQRQGASPQPRDRAFLAVWPTSDTTRWAWGPRRRAGRNLMGGRAAILSGVVAIVAATGAFLLHRQGASSEPVAVKAVVEVARLDTLSPAMAPTGGRADARRSGTLELGDQKVRLARLLIDGHAVLVATSDHSFSMPSNARRLGTEPGAPWIARRGDLGVACLSQPTHMLVVGHLPVERLVEMGRQLEPL